ncbi:MAG TPA: FHIPEP family type III secretion protein, partial [Candidatus Berkiella sp.]|nr:FHIPEP family type III secretion protein [Candidatus Berkiella sp.]
MATANNFMALKQLANIGIGIPIFVVAMLAMTILPLPPFLLDILFTFNITLALMVLLAGTYTARPLDFNVFPTILLLATLLRLALNIASTRVVLLDGHNGTDAAGKVVQSFGEVVVGGNYAVGFVVFMILVIINFVVVTKGAGRISEVSARFTLDSMPGKQMAIDADLNAGIITQEEAKQRRQDVASEADFYGAMDGASKFVRGDAIAGILILLINIFGGFIIGVVQHDISMGEAFRVYGLLTIGDGLVAQIPSLLLSTAAAIMVTRVSSSHDVSQQIKSQVFNQIKPLAIASIVLGVLGLVPGMPHFVFLSIAALLGFGAYYMQQQKNRPQVMQEQTAAENQPIDPGKQEVKEISWDDVPQLDDISLEVGYKLISLLEPKTGG